MKKLYRSKKNKIIGGLCGEIAEFYNIDPTIIRLIAISLAFLSFGWLVIFYLIGWAIVPVNE
jgi:phage shock protein C